MAKRMLIDALHAERYDEICQKMTWFRLSCDPQNTETPCQTP